MSSTLLLSIPVLLCGAALALVVRVNRVSGAISLVTQGLATALVWWAIAPVLFGGAPLDASYDWPQPMGNVDVHVDGLGAFFLVWSLPMTWLGTLYAQGYLGASFTQGRHGGPHFALLNLVSLSFVLVYSMQNALVFLLGWEIAAVCAWLLVIWDDRNQKTRFAGFNYLVSTHIGMFVLVAAFMMLHGKTDSMRFTKWAEFLSTPGDTRSVVFVLMGVSFALKSAFFPFHTWLPRAHAAAPAHVSALMSGVIHKAGLFGFLRFALMLTAPEEWMGWTVLAFGALSAFFGVLYTATQRDLKRLLGYSSTENVGLAAMGFGVGLLGRTWNVPLLTVAGFAGGLMHLFNHALFKCLLFYAAGSVYRAAHTVDLERLGGLAKKLPQTAVLFFVGALAIAALPPLNGFASELVLYSGFLAGAAPTRDANAALLLAAAGLAFVGAVSALSMTRAFGVTFLGNAREPKRDVSSEGDSRMLAPMWLHAGGAVLLGVAPELNAWLTSSAVQLFVPDTVVAPLAAVEGVVWACRGLAVVLLSVGVFGWWRGRLARRSVTWGCGYTAASPRMQYTGSSFSEQFARIFSALLPSLRRQELSHDFFPQRHGHISTTHPDAVERRMFEVLGQGDEFVSRSTDKLNEEPRYAFAAGLIVVLVIGALVIGGLAR